MPFVKKYSHIKKPDDTYLNEIFLLHGRFDCENLPPQCGHKEHQSPIMKQNFWQCYAMIRAELQYLSKMRPKISYFNTLWGEGGGWACVGKIVKNLRRI